MGIFYHLDKFLKCLENLLLANVQEKIQNVFPGDFNRNAFPKCHIYTRFWDMFESYSCSNVTNVPMQIIPESATAIYLCIVCLSPECLKVGTFVSGLSDHLPIYQWHLMVPCIQCHLQSYRSHGRDFSPINIQKFRNRLASYSSNTVIEYFDANMAYDEFFSAFPAAYNIRLPLRIHNKHKIWKLRIKRALWLSRDQLFQKFLQTRD